MKSQSFFLLILFLVHLNVSAESLRVLIAGNAEISLDNPEGTAVTLSYIDSALISLKGDLRFFRGIQLDLTAPPGFPVYRGFLAFAFYGNLMTIPEPGVADVECRQLHFEALPNRIINTWQIPIRGSHGLRASPYIMIPIDLAPPATFPLIFRILPVVKGISEELEMMVFNLQVKPILGDEGAVRIGFNYPQQLQGKPVTVLIDDMVIDNHRDELLLKEGEHHLLVLSEDYRNESRRFMIERAKILDLVVDLQDPTPLLIFESPEGSLIFVDNRPVSDIRRPYPVEPGLHEVRIQMSNYSIIRPITVQKGKTYRVALSVDLNITENN